MIEALFSILWAIVEAILGLLAAVAEWIASFFVAGAEALGIGELIVLALLFGIELVLWVVLVVVELAVALFSWRKPRRVPKPVVWRPKKLRKVAGEDGRDSRQNKLEDPQ